MLSRTKKEQLAGDLAEVFQKAGSIVFTDFGGVATSELNELKASLRAVGARFKVVKKSLVPFASKSSGVNVPLDDHKGSLAIAYEGGEGVETARALNAFAKAHEPFAILGGVFQGGFVAPQIVRELALLPTRDELIGKTVGTIAAPISGFVRVAGGPLYGFINVISRIKEQK